ncbi:hypothetical protein A1Q_3033 [Vibrio campbellii HY01]|nr:hypothetical protein A1Q_3033 [Vibrio campbellii HY01]
MQGECSRIVGASLKHITITTIQNARLDGLFILFKLRGSKHVISDEVVG